MTNLAHNIREPTGLIYINPFKKGLNGPPFHISALIWIMLGCPLKTLRTMCMSIPLFFYTVNEADANG